MAGGGFAVADEGARDYGGKVTFSVVMTCLMAASCGLIYGYDNGVSGGHGQARRVGRQAIMLFGGALFFAGSIINAAAINIAMLIIGRMLLGIGIGFTFQSAPVYLSETAPAKWQGTLASSYNAFLVIGVLAANVTNYFTNRIPGWGWRISLGLATIPGAILVVGAFFVSDTPSSLVLRGQPDQARVVLQKIRGTDANVDIELKDIIRAVEEAQQNEEGAFQRLFSKQYRHYLKVGVAIPALYELTGVSVIGVFLPVLFRTVGFDSQIAMLGSVINSTLNLVSTLMASLVIDHTGRRFLLIIGGLGVVVLEVAFSWIMAAHLGVHEQTTMPRNYATIVLVLILLCTFIIGGTWGPLR
ncbi:hypothetical protein ACP4OV_031088 [Aristida adscensionis]